MAYIYKITNLINNKIYIGQHSTNCSWYYCSGVAIKRAIKKYGKENFKREILVEGNFNKELLYELEKHYIRLYNSFAGTNKLGYNLTTGDRGGSGKIISEETRAKMRLRKVKHSKESKEKMRKAALGKIISQETRNKISKTLTGTSYGKGISRIKNFEKRDSKFVYQYNIQGELINKFNSIAEAAQKLNIPRATVTNIAYKIFKSKKYSNLFLKIEKNGRQ